MERKQKTAQLPHKPSRLGRYLAGIRDSRWLPPLHAARQLRLCEHEILSYDVPREMNGLRIAYASDIHYGALLDEQRVRDLVQKINALDAELVILGGDYGEDAEHTRAFWQLRPGFRAKIAVCGVLGNHDRAQGDADELAALMYDNGVTPLVNNALFVQIGDKRLAVCATDDYNHGDPDFADVAAQVQSADYVIYAPHSPDALEDACHVGNEPFYHLALCGHTHGGQIALFGFAPYTASRHGLRYGNHYRSGEIEENGTVVLISNGVGTTWLPLRLGAPAQYHLIELRHARERME